MQFIPLQQAHKWMSYMSYLDIDLRHDFSPVLRTAPRCNSLRSDFSSGVGFHGLVKLVEGDSQKRYFEKPIVGPKYRGG